MNRSSREDAPCVAQFGVLVTEAYTLSEVNLCSLERSVTERRHVWHRPDGVRAFRRTVVGVAVRVALNPAEKLAAGSVVTAAVSGAGKVGYG